LQWQFIVRYDTQTAQEPGSLFWFRAVRSLQCTCARSFSCRAGCETGKSFFCGWSSFRNNDTSTNLQKFPSNMAEGVLSHVSVERRHPGVWCSETLTADSGKPRRFILCEKTHEW